MQLNLRPVLGKHLPHAEARQTRDVSTSAMALPKDVKKDLQWALYKKC